MAKEHCKFHSTKPAVWRCERCRMPLCPDCVPGSRENYENEMPDCALCSSGLKYLGGANIAKPFWTQAGAFFTHPLKTAGLVTLVVMTAISAVLPQSMIGLIGMLLLSVFTVHYGLNIIERVRYGDMVPPKLADVFEPDAVQLLLKQIAVMILLGLFVVGAAFLDPVLGFFAMLFVLLAVPASTMLLVMTGSVTEAVHPRDLALLMLRIGPTYLLLWVCLMIVAAGPSLVMPMLAPVLPEQALYPAFMFVSAYFTFVTYVMMGYILYEKQAVLGFTSHEDFGETLDYKVFMTRRAIANARIMASANRHAQALETLRTAIGVDESNADLRELYFRIVSDSGDEEATRRNANSICDFYISRKLPIKAANFCAQTRKRYPDFVPKDSTACHQVAEQWFEQGHHKDAAALILHLHKNAPEYPDMVSALILVARIFFEGMDAKEKAIALLLQVRLKHPDHPEMPRVNRLLDVMNGSATA
ncbi:MAG TPA: hypothetical protein VF275_00445 [Gammaproteobacteria bacterium]